MSARFVLLRVLLVAAGASAIGVLFVPIAFAFVMVWPPQGGAASLWTISPLLTSTTIVLIVLVAARTIARPSTASRRHLLILGAVTLFASVGGLLYTFSPFAEFGFHPYAIACLFTTSVMLFAAGLVIGRSQEPGRFHFRLREVFMYVAFAALIGGFVRAAIR